MTPGIDNPIASNEDIISTQLDNIHIIITPSERGGIYNLCKMLANISPHFIFKRNSFKLLFNLNMNIYSQKYIIITSPKLLLFYITLLLNPFVRKKIVYWPHHLPHVSLQPYKILSYIYYIIEFIALKLSIKFIFVSNYQKDSYKEYYKSNKLSQFLVLPPTLGGLTKEDIKNTNRKIVLTHNKPFVFTIFSRFDKDSKTKRLIYNLRRFLSRINNKTKVEIHLYGSGVMYQNFCHHLGLSKKSKNIKLVKKGWSSNVANDMRSCNCVLVEGQGETYHLISALAIHSKVPILNLTDKHPLNQLLKHPVISQDQLSIDEKLDLVKCLESLRERAMSNHFLETLDEYKYANLIHNYVLN